MLPLFKQSISTLLAVFCLLTASAQNTDSTTFEWPSDIDTTIWNNPPKVRWRARRDVDLLTHKLIAGHHSDLAKASVLGTWIANNITYDVNALVANKRRKYTSNQTLRRGKAICQGYADLFTEMATIAGLECYNVPGYDKGMIYEPGDQFFRPDHVWNGVKIDGQWRMMDLSWSGGFAIEKRRRIRYWLSFIGVHLPPKYKFIGQPSKEYLLGDWAYFYATHYPEHPWWKLAGPQYELDDFEQLHHDATPSFPMEVYIVDNQVQRAMGKPKPGAYLEHAKKAYQLNDSNDFAMAWGHGQFSWTQYDSLSNVPASEEAIAWNDSLITHLDLAKGYMKTYKKLARWDWKTHRTKNSDYKKNLHKSIRSEVKTTFKNKTQIRKEKNKRKIMVRKRLVLDKKERLYSKYLWQYTGTRYKADKVDDNKAQTLLDSLVKWNDQAENLAELLFTINDTLMALYNMRRDSTDSWCISQQNELFEIDLHSVNNFLFNWRLEEELDSIWNQYILNSDTTLRIKNNIWNLYEEAVWFEKLQKRYINKFNSKSKKAFRQAIKMSNLPVLAEPQNAYLQPDSLLEKFQDNIDHIRKGLQDQNVINKTLIKYANYDERKAKEEKYCLRSATRVEYIRYASYNGWYHKLYGQRKADAKRFESTCSRYKTRYKKLNLHIKFELDKLERKAKAD